MANNTWKNYTQKSTALSDNDEVMLLDSTDEKNKRGLMSKFWDYVVDKMATAVISKLETNNKTIIGAINALNSESFSYKKLDATSYAEYVEECYDKKRPGMYICLKNDKMQDAPSGSISWIAYVLVFATSITSVGMLLHYDGSTLSVGKANRGSDGSITIKWYTIK